MPVIYCTRCMGEDNNLIKTVDYNTVVYRCNACGCIHMVMGSRHFTVVEACDIYNTIPKFDDAVKMAEAARDMSMGIKVKASAYSLHDAVNHPKHYASGMSVEVECIMFTRHLNFDIGNAFKYVWRAGNKDSFTQDINKAMWYLDDADLDGLSVGKPEFIDFLPKSSLEGWKYETLRYILQGKARDAHGVLSNKLKSLSTAS